MEIKLCKFSNSFASASSIKQTKPKQKKRSSLGNCLRNRINMVKTDASQQDWVLNNQVVAAIDMEGTSSTSSSTSRKRRRDSVPLDDSTDQSLSLGSFRFPLLLCN